MATNWTKPTHLLSDNRKCGASIDLPIQGHCTPTANCVKDCYARVGFQGFPAAKRKQDYISKYLANGNIDALIKECKSRPSIRLNGSGDLLDTHIPAISRLAEACPDTTFWGMTRKTHIANALNKAAPNLKVLVSVDATSPKETWDHQGPLCYGPRRPEDKVPNDNRIITIFPKHVHGTVKDTMPTHAKDCPAVRHEVDGCLACNRCSSW